MSENKGYAGIHGRTPSITACLGTVTRHCDNRGPMLGIGPKLSRRPGGNTHNRNECTCQVACTCRRRVGRLTTYGKPMTPSAASGRNQTRVLSPSPALSGVERDAKSAKKDRATMPSDLGALCGFARDIMPFLQGTCVALLSECAQENKASTVNSTKSTARPSAAAKSPLAKSAKSAKKTPRRDAPPNRGNRRAYAIYPLPLPIGASRLSLFDF